MERIMLNEQKIDVVGDWVGSPYQKWAYNYIAKHLWRVQHIIGDQDDMMQEAAIEFILMKRDYGSKVNSPKQFMRLYQLCLMSHVTNISNRDSRSRETLAKVSTKEPAVRPDAEITIVLNEASGELKQVLGIFFNAPAEVMDVLRKEANSCSPKQFWLKVLRHCGMQDKSEQLTKELNRLLS